MTTTQTTQTDLHVIPARLDFDAAAPAFSKALTHLDNTASRELDRVEFPVGLRDLLRLRASQLNGCAYCVDTHSRDALAGGEPIGRVAAVAVWRESSFFTPKERAALAFAESVTLAPSSRVPDADYEEVAAHWSPDEIGALLALIVTINAWNLIGVATRTWETTLDE